jgi:hypothetical protein
MTLIQRRAIKISFALLTALFLIGYLKLIEFSTDRGALFSGWFLFGFILILMFLNLTRKLPFYSWSKARIWSQIHIYSGAIAIAIFFIHTSGQLPEGWLEWTLFLGFIFVSITGLVGLFFYRTFPQRLSRRGHEVIYERIAENVIRIRREAEAILENITLNGESAIIADFYFQKLYPFFEKNRNFYGHLFESKKSTAAILHGLHEIKRYLNDVEKTAIQEFVLLVEEKDHLDYHYALQKVLKTWLFVHIPLAYVVFILVMAHIMTISAFWGLSPA